ncbi:unknown [Parabacteroides johnsonii CAG:246]|nr:unknown [Parabacteroides johnsonii CAG:246]
MLLFKQRDRTQTSFHICLSFFRAVPVQKIGIPDRDKLGQLAFAFGREEKFSFTRKDLHARIEQKTVHVSGNLKQTVQDIVRPIFIVVQIESDTRHTVEHTYLTQDIFFQFS